MSTTSIDPRVLELLRCTETHQRHSETLARATGEHFNIFQVLRIGHLEVTTHSPILAELLNPKGNHGQGAAFLRLFLTQFKIDGFDAESGKASIALEYYAGPVTEKSGGRLDIVVKDGKGSTILIENKIYASDQDNQLARYRNSYPKAHLFYLTLEGRKPSTVSEDDLARIHYECISYENDVLSWLKNCRKEATCLPGLRETISQYIHLIQDLTNQSTTTLMSKELIDEIVQKKENLAAFFYLRNAEQAVRDALIAQLDVQLNEISHTTGLKREGSLKELHKKDSGFYFTTPGLQQHNLRIGFLFEKGYYGDFYFGFDCINLNAPCPVKEQVLTAFKTHFPAGEPTTHVPAWAWWEEPYRYWKAEAFEAIRSGQFATDLKAKLEILAKIARQVCPDDLIKQTAQEV